MKVFINSIYSYFVIQINHNLPKIWVNCTGVILTLLSLWLACSWRNTGQVSCSVHLWRVLLPLTLSLGCLLIQSHHLNSGNRARLEETECLHVLKPWPCNAYFARILGIKNAQGLLLKYQTKFTKHTKTNVSSSNYSH